MLSLHRHQAARMAFSRMLFRSSVVCCMVTTACGTWAAEESDSASAPFQPGEISIGEPLQLPARPRIAAPAETPTIEAPRVAPEASAAVPPAAGNGWIGLTVDDKLVTGRLVVVDVAAAGPADQAGVRVQNHLLAIDGVPLRSADQLAAALAAIAPGSTVKVAIGRGDRIDEVSLQATARPSKPLAREWQKAEPTEPTVVREPLPAFAPAVAAPARTPPANSPPQAAASGTGRTALGVRTMPVDPAVAERFKLTQPSGALVIGVVHDLPASKAGVPPGSVIVALDNQPVRSPNELTQLVTRGPIGRPVTLQYILPGGEQRRAEVSLQSLEVPLERALVGPEE
jgi:predicted metalloprotease with PDZ domain